MSPTDTIASLRALLERATPGPWTTDACYLVAEVPGGRPGGEVIAECRATVERLRAAWPHRDNALAIAALANAAPALLDVASMAAQLIWSADKLRQLTGKPMARLIENRQMHVTEEALRDALARLTETNKEPDHG